MIVANVDSIVAADRIDGQEGLLILYKSSILVSGTVAKTYLISLYLHNVSSPQLCTRLVTKTTMPTRQASTTQRAKRCKKALLRTNPGRRGILSHATKSTDGQQATHRSPWQTSSRICPVNKRTPPLANAIVNG